ncbi:MAG: hypothetical protein COZ18_16970 [Flexibacter sp. CG_4_10_14_3_um_filter_32_15]|nr:MAG: hypothetical protein COZ18_16970 [Flexibacter sp. CG_4_10_14_3_um_filter_32_15]
MKKIFFSFLLIFPITAYSQSMYSEIKSKIDYMIYQDSKSWKASKYKGGLTLLEAKEKSNHYLCSGTFKYKVWGVGTIHYQAIVKVVLDEIVVKKIWWTQPYTNVTYTIGGD